MFSATFPRQMEALARKILQKPIEVQVGGRSVVCRDVDQNVVGGRLNFLWVIHVHVHAVLHYCHKYTISTFNEINT